MGIYDESETKISHIWEHQFITCFIFGRKISNDSMRLCFEKCDISRKQQELCKSVVLQSLLCVSLFTEAELLFNFAKSLWIMCFWPLNPSSVPELLLSALLHDKPLTAGLRL